MSIIELNAKQYKNLKITYSKKNNIDSVAGTEYLARLANNGYVDFDITSLKLYDKSGALTNDIKITNSENLLNIGYTTNPSYPVASPLVYPFTSLNSITSNTSNYITRYFTHQELNSDYDDLLVEQCSIKGRLTAQTQSAILGIGSISASAQLTYDSYEFKELNEKPIQSNFTTTQTPTLECIRATTKQVNRYGENRENVQTQNTSEALKYEASYASVPAQGFLWWQISQGAYGNINLIQKPTMNFYNIDIQQSGGNTIVTCDFEISIWSGRNQYYTSGINKEYRITLDVVKQIAFSITANNIETEPFDFNYSRGNNNKQYALEDSNLIQFKSTQRIEDRQSYKTSQSILDASSENRMVISFDLLDCKKYEFITREFIQIPETQTQIDLSKTYYTYNEQTDTLDGISATSIFINPVIDVDNETYYEDAYINEYRYLKTGDLIRIKDINGKYIGNATNTTIVPNIRPFEIVSIHYKWDGTYHMEIVCKQASTWSE